MLLVLWDTARADRLSLYGHEAPTTPFLEEWSRGARVFEDCLSTAGSTVPSHASLFTGLVPTEHGASNRQRSLDPRFETLAERFAGGGYRTYLWSANPHVSSAHHFAQGFEVEAHPWDPEWEEQALAILRAKVDPGDLSSELPAKIQSGRVKSWDIKASGDLARRSLAAFVGESDLPFFAFVNYMEAHRPFVPPRDLRERLMSPRELRDSYAIDRGWDAMWDFVFGLSEYEEAELEVMAKTYDATLLELDGLFADLLATLDELGRLEGSVVALTADHGEHLGERHLLDHQYSLYQGLLHVPLVLRGPGVEPGRDPRPVMHYDLYPTLLELAGLALPAHLGASANPAGPRSLLRPADERPRLAEMLGSPLGPLQDAKERHPEWNPKRYRRSLRAIFAGNDKLIWSSDGRHELYPLPSSEEREEDQAAARRERVVDLLRALAELDRSLAPYAGEGVDPELSEEQRQRLEALGYARD